MTAPLAADEFLAVLRAEGVRVAEHPGWRTHNRAGHGAWGPVNGVMIHHTAGVAPSDGEIVWAGRPDLPGPCAHGYLAKGGVVTMTANGRANHAGGGDPAVLAAVVGEAYTTAPPAPHEHEGSGGAVDGNAHFYGLEISNRGDGKDPYPTAQYDAAVRWAAAICRHHGWSAKSVIGHKEWSDWKPDPSFDIERFRADVAARLAHTADWTPQDPTPEDDMPLTADDLTKIKALVHDEVQGLLKARLVSPTDPKGGTRYVGDYIRYGDQHTADILTAVRATSAATNAAIGTLAAQLGEDVDTATVVAAVQQAIAAAVVHVQVDVDSPATTA